MCVGVFNVEVLKHGLDQTKLIVCFSDPAGQYSQLLEKKIKLN